MDKHFVKRILSYLLISFLFVEAVYGYGNSGINNPWNGGTVTGDATFSGAVTINGVNKAVNIAPAGGSGSVTINPGIGNLNITGGGVLTIAPGGGGNMDGVIIGQNTPQTGVFAGIVSASNASAGNVAEVLSTTVLSGAAIGLTSGVSKDIATLNLTAGDWDVWATNCFTANAATTATIFEGGISTTLNTLPTPPGAGAYMQENLSVGAGGVEPCQATGMMQENISVATTMHLVANVTFAVNTMSGYGYIGARRRR